MTRTDFSHRLRATPVRPGVYLMRNEAMHVMYVGKASNLRNRIRSYFASSANLSPKIRRMVDQIADFEYIVAESEQEALILECNLIKEHKPQYTARLKDDKSYPFIKIDVSEEFPQVYITRKVTNDGARYFGPFANAGSVRRTLNTLKKLFPYRSCTKQITGTDDRACLDYYINRCIGPCIGVANQLQYSEVINQVIYFLEGKTKQVVQSIETRMLKASDELEFEKAAALRDQLEAIEKVHEGQKVLHLTSENVDVIAASSASREAWVEVFFIRQGKLIGRDNFLMSGTQGDSQSEILTAFVKQFYDANPYVPPKILVEHPLEDTKAIEIWLRGKRSGAVQIHVPQRGEKRRLIHMVSENASQGLQQLRLKQMADHEAMDSAMEELREALNLPRLPKRIECYDISNIQGTNPVGSMVVFQNGKPKNSDYRRFKIKSVNGIDDYSMMREMLTRRFKRLEQHAKEDSGSDTKNNKWGAIPDLVLIDGGKGHLGAALNVFLDLGIRDIPLASLAKENEELFVPQTPEPIILPSASQGMYLVQRARDEAHRFAITFHRARRSKKSVQSALDLVPGIGPKRKRMLLRRFGSIKGIQEASPEQLGAVPGITLSLALN